MRALQASLAAIVDAIGADAAAKLVDHFGGMQIYVPATFGHRSRKAEIAAAEGTDQDVAHRLGVSVRWVKKVRRGK